MTPFADPHETASYARSQWEEAEHRVARVAQDSRRAGVLERVIDEIMYELEKRVGQTFATAELARVWDDAERWCLDVAHRTAPEDPWAWDMSLVQGAAFFRYSRRAQDYQL